MINRYSVNVRYEETNSGGHWWVSDDSYKRLNDEGWKMGRVSHAGGAGPEGHVAGATRRVTVSALSHMDAKDVAIDLVIAEWEEITGCSASELGCRCCGAPHYFTATDSMVFMKEDA